MNPAAALLSLWLLATALPGASPVADVPMEASLPAITTTGGAVAEAGPSDRSCLYYLLTFGPILALGVILFAFLIPYARLVRRNWRHMDEVERLTRGVLETLSRIEQRLDRR